MKPVSSHRSPVQLSSGQGGLDQEAQALNTQSQDRYQDFKGDQVKKSVQRLRMLGDIAGRIGDVAVNAGQIVSRR